MKFFIALVKPYLDAYLRSTLIEVFQQIVRLPETFLPLLIFLLIDRNGYVVLILKEIWANDAAAP